MFADDVIVDFMMLQNQEHYEIQRDMALQFYLSPFKDKKAKFKYTQLPFPDLSRNSEKKRILTTAEFALKRQELRKKAPKYDLRMIETKLGQLKNG